MAAMRLEAADAPASVAEQHEVLAHGADLERELAEFRGHRHRLPEAAQILAARRLRSGMGERRILPRQAPAVILAEGLLEAARPFGADLVHGDPPAACDGARS